MSSYTLQKFSVEKYGSSALKCRVGRLHTILSNCFTFKSRIYMKKPQNPVGSNISGYPARLSTSYIYEVESRAGYPEMLDPTGFWGFFIYILLLNVKQLLSIV